MKHLNITVKGKVQNVGFRFYTNKKAVELGIKGYVKNMPDGSVYIEAEADEVTLDHFVLWCKKGPSWARVDELLIQDAPIDNSKEPRQSRARRSQFSIR